MNHKHKTNWSRTLTYFPQSNKNIYSIRNSLHSSTTLYHLHRYSVKILSMFRYVTMSCFTVPCIPFFVWRSNHNFKFILQTFYNSKVKKKLFMPRLSYKSVAGCCRIEEKQHQIRIYMDEKQEGQHMCTHKVTYGVVFLRPKQVEQRGNIKKWLTSQTYKIYIRNRVKWHPLFISLIIFMVGHL